MAQQRSEAAQAPFNENAYRVGERLTYDVDFSHFMSAAHVELFVAARGRFFNRDGIQLRAHVETSGVVNVALFAINSDYTTYVDPESGLPFRSQQVVRGADRASEFSSDYNQPAGTDAVPSTLKTGEFPGTYDLISALYRARAMPLVDGASYFITVRAENEEFHAELKVSGKQRIKTDVGSFNAIATRVNVKGGHDYNIRVYFSDDERHVPVLIIAKHPAGEIRAELAGSEIVPPPFDATVITWPMLLVAQPATNPATQPAFSLRKLVFDGNIAGIKAALDHGADVNARDDHGACTDRIEDQLEPADVAVRPRQHPRAEQHAEPHADPGREARRGTCRPS